MKVSIKNKPNKPDWIGKKAKVLVNPGVDRCPELLSEFQDLAHAGIYDWDIVNNVFSCSKELLILFGKDPQDKTLSNLFEHVDRNDLDLLISRIQASITTASKLLCDFKVLKDKSLVFLGLKGKVYKDKKGKPVRIVGTVFDITENKWAEEELNNKNIAILNAYKKLEKSQEELKKLNNELESRVLDRTNALQQSESELRTLSETIPHLVWRTNSKGEYDYFNNKWFEYTGSTFEKCKGLKWLTFVHPDDLAAVKEAWKTAVKEGGIFFVEYRLRKSDGSYRWFQSKGIPIEGTEGKIKNWVGTSTDIEDQKKINEKKDEFIGIASHELKTPLTSIKAYIQLLLRNKKNFNDPVSITYLEKTDSYINKLNSLIADLLDVSKIQAGKLQFNRTEFKFDELVRECVETMQQITDSHNIKLIGSSGATVYGDRQRLEQVFFNFISNAIKYSPDANEVIVEVKKVNGSVQVCVKDFGIGIAKEKLEKLFSRFYRVEGLSPTFTGLGIGLFIAAEILKRHKGKFWVESEEHKGSTFYFSIPVEKKNTKGKLK